MSGQVAGEGAPVPGGTLLDAYLALHGLVGTLVLVAWPRRPGVRIWMEVLEVDQRFGKWQLRVSVPGALPGGDSLWVRSWEAAAPSGFSSAHCEAGGG